MQKLSGYLNSTIEDIKKIETAPEVQLMYYLFHEHHLLPGDYWRLPAGERVVLRAFFIKDMEQRRECRG